MGEELLLQDGRYLLLETLGRGGTGAVFGAFDRTEQRRVAIKVAADRAQVGPGHPLASEFETASSLDHPGILRAYELGTARRGPLPRDTPYLVLEHVAGRPAHLAVRAGADARREIPQLASRLLHALAHLHDAGYVHRDLKPANVLIDREDGGPTGVKLIDLGLAARMGDSRATGTFSGSLAYAAPEALLGLPLDGRADLYSLGLLLYRVLTGRLPVASGGAEAILRWHAGGVPADPSLFVPELDPRLARFVRRLTAACREARPASAREALDLLGGETMTLAPVERAVPSAERAKLRLALDATRLGSSRLFRLPRSPEQARALLRDVAVWAQVRGTAFVRIERGDEPPALALGRAVLRLLAERGADAASCVRSHGLDRALPLEMVGDWPVLDRSRPNARCADDAETLAGVVAFVLDCARCRPLVLCAETGGRGDPIERVVRELARAVERRDGRQFTREGGLLLLLAVGRPPHRSRRAAARSLPGSAAVTEAAPRWPRAWPAWPC